MDLKFKNPLDQKFFDLIKRLDDEDWRELRDDNYWWEECPFTGKKVPRGRTSKIELIEYYVKHGVRKNQKKHGLDK
jgi:hypothetical protein